MFTVYILYSSSIDKYYVGCTSNFEARLKKHNTNHKGFTGKIGDWKVVYMEKFLVSREALFREKQIKAWKSRKMIERLISEKALSSQL